MTRFVVYLAKRAPLRRPWMIDRVAWKASEVASNWPRRWRPAQTRSSRISTRAGRPCFGAPVTRTGHLIMS
eukprot:2857507-Pyramimonas_sp.AAC.1